MRQYRYTPGSEVDFSPLSTADQTGSRSAIGNGARLDRSGLEGTGAGDIKDGELADWLSPDADTDLGPGSAERVAATPLPPDDGESGTPPPDITAVLGPLESPGREAEVMHAEATHDMPAFGELTGLGELSDLGIEAAVLAPSADGPMAEYESEEAALIADAVGAMSVDEKRGSLSEMGYSGESIASMSPAMMDQALLGTLTSQVRFLKIQGMTPAELQQLPVDEQRKFLSDLGVPTDDLQKAKDRYIRSAVSDVVAKSKMPGHHTVRLKIKGGFFRKKSYDIQLQVNDDGHLAGVDIDKKGGFFSKLGGFIKRALPFIAKLLAGVTGGLSLVALGVYNAIQAARSGNWIGAISAAAGGLAGAGLGLASTMAEKVSQLAQSTQAGLLAIQSKSPGGLLAAISKGAGTVAGFAADQASTFATTLKGWSERLGKMGSIATGAEASVAAAQRHDPLAAVEAALSTVGRVQDARQPGTSTGGRLEFAQDLSRHTRLARAAIGSKPPQYDTLASSVLGMAGEFHASGRIDSASRLVSRGQALQAAVVSGDPQQMATAVLGVAEAIELAHGGGPGLDAERRQQVGEKYRRTHAVVSPSVAVITGLKTGDWEQALESSADLVAVLDKDGLSGSAATITQLSFAVKSAVASGDSERMVQAARALGEEVKQMWAWVRASDEDAAQAPLDVTVLMSSAAVLNNRLSLSLPSRFLAHSASTSMSAQDQWSGGCGGEETFGRAVSPATGEADAFVGPPEPEHLALREFSKCMSAAACTGGVAGDSTYVDQVLSTYYAMDGLEVQLSASQLADVSAFKRHYEANRARYDRVAGETGVPAKLIAALHWRESGYRANAFDTYLHQGDPLGHPAVHWPTDIPVFGRDQWEEAAIHALNSKNESMSGLMSGLGLDATSDSAASMATYAEYWNGLGYSNRGMRSPYVFGATNKQQDGKFTADHADGFDPDHRDQQVGVLPLLGALGGMTSPVDLSPTAMSPEAAWSASKTRGSLVRKGDMGAVVEALQSRLVQLGHTLSVDGHFGEQTRVALAAFQAGQPGLVADGVLGPGSASRLDAVLAGTAQSSPSKPEAPSAPDGPIVRVFQDIAQVSEGAVLTASFGVAQLRRYLEDDLQFAQGEWFRGTKLDGATESLMETLDQSGDGKVSWVEFQGITDQLAAVLMPGGSAELTMAETIQAATDYFDALPGAGDGVLEFDDLKDAAEGSLPDATDHRGLVAQLVARLVIDVLDTDERAMDVEDRTVSRAEWVEAVVACCS